MQILDGAMDVNETGNTRGLEQNLEQTPIFNNQDTDLAKEPRKEWQGL